MSYTKEFSDRISVPDYLLTPPWQDVSWHNDVCPRFENEEIRLAIWVDYDDPADREFDDWRKFTVNELVLRSNDLPVLEEETLFETDDSKKLLEWLELYSVKYFLERTIAAVNDLSKPYEALADELISAMQLITDHMEDLKN